MRIFKILLTISLSIAFVFVCGIGLASDVGGRAETERSVLSFGDVLYKADFEKEDDTCSWESEFNKVTWNKEGANGSNGCLKLTEPAEGKVMAEIPLNWYGSQTYVDFDYYVVGFKDEITLMSFGAEAGCNLRAEVKDFAKGKWAHAQFKAKELKWRKKSGESDVFRNLIIMASGIDESESKHVLLIDNVTVTAVGQKKEGVELKRAK